MCYQLVHCSATPSAEESFSAQGYELWNHHNKGIFQRPELAILGVIGLQKCYRSRSRFRCQWLTRPSRICYVIAWIAYLPVFGFRVRNTVPISFMEVSFDFLFVPPSRSVLRSVLLLIGHKTMTIRHCHGSSGIR